MHDVALESTLLVCSLQARWNCIRLQSVSINSTKLHRWQLVQRWVSDFANACREQRVCGWWQQESHHIGQPRHFDSFQHHQPSWKPVRRRWSCFQLAVLVPQLWHVKLSEHRSTTMRRVSGVPQGSAYCSAQCTCRWLETSLIHTASHITNLLMAGTTQRQPSRRAPTARLLFSCGSLALHFSCVPLHEWPRLHVAPKVTGCKHWLVPAVWLPCQGYSNHQLAAWCSG